MTVEGGVHRSELNTAEPGRAADDVRALLGWTVEAVPMPDGGTDRVARAGERMAAGIFDVSGPGFEGVPAP